MFAVESEAFYTAMQAFSDPAGQVELSRMIEADCLILLWQNHLAGTGDRPDSLEPDAADLMLEVEFELFKQLPLFVRAGRYADGEQRKAALLHIFQCRLVDLWRRRKREQDRAAVSLDDAVFADGTPRGSQLAAETPDTRDPCDILAGREPVSEESPVWQVLHTYAALKTAPANRIAFLYKTLCTEKGGEGESALCQPGRRSGRVKQTLEALNGKSHLEALLLTHRRLCEQLRCGIPQSCLQPLYDALLAPDPQTGALLAESPMRLTPDKVSDRSSWIESRTRAEIERICRGGRPGGAI